MKLFSVELGKAYKNYNNAKLSKLSININQGNSYKFQKRFTPIVAVPNMEKTLSAKINDDTLGFIITRHVNSHKTNQYWIECINRIKLFYPISKIVIIDDNSNPLFLNENGVDLTNCTIIESEFKGRGELLPYYYLYKNHFFEKAIIMHDSVFIQYPINTSNVKNIRFLWSFNGSIIEDNNIERNLIIQLNKTQVPMLLHLHNNKNIWNGCFGVMSIITYDFVKILNDKYDFFNLLEIVKSRKFRCCLERVFGVICYNECRSDIFMKPHIIGNIHQCYPDYGYSYEQYKRDRQLNLIPWTRPFVKVWTGR